MELYGNGQASTAEKGIVSHEGDFVRKKEENFTGYHQSLKAMAESTAQVVFPGGGRWEIENRGLYDQMKDSLSSNRRSERLWEGNRRWPYCYSGI